MKKELENLIDTHCHLYLPEFDKDRDDIIQRARDAGVEKFFLPNIDSRSVNAMLSLSSANSGICYPMMGLHPCSVKDDWLQQIAEIEKYLFETPEVKFYGIGETGLDYYWDKSFIGLQKQNFQKHINWAKEFRLPIIIHSREATEDCISLIKENYDQNLTGIFHCFAGSIEQAHEIAEMGFYLGIGGVVTYKNAGLDKIVEQIDLDHIVLETDSPYLAPVPHRGKRNESSYLTFITSKVAAIKNKTPEEVASITTRNAMKVFQLSF